VQAMSAGTGIRHSALSVLSKQIEERQILRALCAFGLRRVAGSRALNGQWTPRGCVQTSARKRVEPR
jgi:hypothetical protein